ncbi:putative F420-dependent oxidoreductase [Spinactinospora alkalitolerans]|uniref:Putative F420-dependent oxidoreductase n=1 Tax=Spinactinospora alkalitolerans TaxID=687207 RepID=A0A852TXV4_9ACTN|nr:TIGR03621 family F420-dependent LLM class oxidoreductase [Spinactinospora alkalitolerans]NYE48829.1 putative F420-dependent oxidoreductase [Spinactinospora alkalitolerans]
MTKFRFGINYSDATGDGWTGFCRTSEEMGFDVILAPDHLGAPAPFAMLAAAAAVTTRTRLGTYVANNEFWNPAMPAREAATVDRLSGGRLELGLGCGYMRSEFESAGIPWRGHPERVDRLERGITELDRLFTGDGPRPLPGADRRPPLLVGGHGERILALAAERADIVGFSGLRQRRAAGPGALVVAGAEETLRRVELVRRRAGARAGSLEFSVLVHAVLITDDAERTAAETAEKYAGVGLETARDVLDSPYILVGTVDEIAAELVADRDRFGFGYVATHGPFRDALARVIPRVRELEAARGIS